MKKISIITITHNSELTIEQTIKSVVSQTFNDYEYVIVDGNSSDKTLSIIKKYEDYYSKWVSEPDSGISEAMNKGIELSTGEFLLFLHSDDYLLAEDTLLNASKWLNNEHEIFAFGIYYGNGERFRPFYPRGFNYWMNFKFGLLHQGVLCHRSVFEKIGNFDTNFKLTMDYDFFLRAYRNGMRLKRCNYPLSFMRNTGISSGLDNASLKERFLEEKKVHYKNNPSKLLLFLYSIYWRTYPKYRKIHNF